ncbi:VOC family protein [Nonomuraea maheshkhaliensis]|uniref:VOC family protein n=1 Tax=Nonomuraea maheshkhaliensis TaxID=419590 RepID=A0ABP4TT52_9ACTN
MSVAGIDFVALQVRDLAKSAEFYEKRLGLKRAPGGPPNAVVFAAEPIPFAVREPLPGVELPERPGTGVVLWLGTAAAGDAQRLHDDLQAAGVPIVAPPADSPFGRTFSFADPDGYVITIHDR